MAQTTKQLLTRLKSVEGHVRGIQRMAETDAYCIDLIRQGQAVQRALDKWCALVLEEHLITSVTDALRGDEPAERERVVAELLNVFQPGGQLGSRVPAQGLAGPQRAAALDAIIEGVRLLQNRLVANEPCVDLMRSAQALQSEIGVFNGAVLADHLRGCVTRAVRGEQPDERARVVHELLQVFDTTMTL